MTQARDLLPLRLQLTPMQLPETNPQAVVKATGGNEARTPSGLLPVAGSLGTAAAVRGCKLVLHPGEPSEILVQLENLSNQPLHLNIQLEGDFPSEWCRLGMEGHELPPRGQMEAVLYFQIPADFFEEQDALRPGQSLRVDYQGRIYVHYAQQAIEQLDAPPAVLPSIESANFNLYVRPRSLYRDFLPEIYRDVDFIGRLLKIFEQAFEPAVEALDVLWAYLDPLTAPEALLPFLAYWVGWTLIPGLSQSRQRYLICQAMELYRLRGTRRGLRLYLHLYTDLPLDEHLPEEEKHISIQEVFGRGFLVGETHLSHGSIIGGGQLYHFIVTLRPDNTRQLNEPIDERLMRQIIEQEKPAFCTYELYIVSSP